MKKLIGLSLITISSVIASDIYSLPPGPQDEDHLLTLPAAWILTRRLNKVDYELTQESPLVKQLAGKTMIPSRIWDIVVRTSSDYDHKHNRNEALNGLKAVVLCEIPS